MARIRISILFLLWLTGSTSCLAGSRAGLYLGGGGNLAVGDLGERAETGYHAGLGAGVPLAAVPSGGIEFILRGFYHRLLSDTDTEGDFSFVAAGVDVKISYRQRNGSTLYLILGGGYAKARREQFMYRSAVATASGLRIIERQIESRSENDFYASPGFGAELAAGGPIKPFIEFRFTDVSGTYISDYQFVTVTLGIKI